MIAWKVFNPFSDGTLHSATPCGAMFIYSTKTPWTRAALPHNHVMFKAKTYGPACCFETKAQAKQFAFEMALAYRSKRVVRRVKIVKSKCKYVWAGNRRYHKVKLCRLPVGTILADKVTILEDDAIETQNQVDRDG